MKMEIEKIYKTEEYMRRKSLKYYSKNKEHILEKSNTKYLERKNDPVFMEKRRKQQLERYYRLRDLKENEKIKVNI